MQLLKPYFGDFLYLLYVAQILDGFKTLGWWNTGHFWRGKVNWELAQVRTYTYRSPRLTWHLCWQFFWSKTKCTSGTHSRGGPHTWYINCVIPNFLYIYRNMFESWFQQRFLLHKGKKNSSHFGSPKVAILDDPEKWPFLIPIQCLFWNVWFIKTAGVAAMRRDGK